MKKIITLFLGVMLSFFISQSTAQICNVPCNGRITPNTGWSTSSAPFANALVNCWQPAHGNPALSSKFYSTPASTKLYGISTTWGSGIITTERYPMQTGSEYILSLMQRIDTLGKNIDTLIVALVDTNVNNPNWQIPSPSQQIILKLSNLSDTTWKQQVVCFTPTISNPFIWIYIKVKGNSGKYILIDDIEILQNFDFAGYNTTICSASVCAPLGDQCPKINLHGSYELRDCFGDPADDPGYDSVFQVCGSGAFKSLKRTLYKINGDTIPCATRTTCVTVTLGSYPKFSLGNDTLLCQGTTGYTLCPQMTYPITTYIGQPYHFLWNNGETVPCRLAHESGSYILRITDTTTGCYWIDTIVVTNDPNLPIRAHPRIVCAATKTAGFWLCTTAGYTQYGYINMSILNNGIFIPMATNCLWVTANMWNGNTLNIRFRAKANSLINCYGYDTVNLTIGTVTANLGPDTSICVNPQQYTMRVSDSFSVYQWRKVPSSTILGTGYQYTATSSGTYTVLVSDGGSCNAIDTIVIHIASPATITIPFSIGAFCKESGLIPLDSVASPYGGVYSGTGVRLISGHYYFKTDSADCGWNTLTYVYNDTNNCPATATTKAFVYCGKHVDSLPTLCHTDTAVMLNGYPPFGTYSGSGVYKTGDQWYFDPRLVTLTHELDSFKILYYYTDSGSCYGTDSIYIKVNNGPIGHIIDPLDTFNCSVPHDALMKCLKDGYTLKYHADSTHSGSIVYLWSTGSTADSIIIHSTGTYWVKVHIGSGCDYYDTLIVDKDPCNCCINDYVYNSFEKNFDLGGYYHRPVAIKTDSVNNYHYVLLNTDPVDSGFNDLPVYRYFTVQKLDKTGTVLWQKSYGTGKLTGAADLELDSNKIVVLFNTLDTTNYFDTITALYGYNDQTHIIQLDTSGTILQYQQYGWKQAEWCHDLIVTTANYVVVGVARRPSTENCQDHPIFILPTGYNYSLNWNLYLLKVKKSDLQFDDFGERMYSTLVVSCGKDSNCFDSLSRCAWYREMAYEEGVGVVEGHYNGGSSYIISGNLDGYLGYENPTDHNKLLGIKSTSRKTFVLNVDPTTGNTNFEKVLDKDPQSDPKFYNDTLMKHYQNATSLNKLGNSYYISGHCMKDTSGVDTNTFCAFVAKFNDSLNRLFYIRITTDTGSFETVSATFGTDNKLHVLGYLHYLDYDTIEHYLPVLYTVIPMAIWILLGGFIQRLILLIITNH